MEKIRISSELHMEVDHPETPDLWNLVDECDRCCTYCGQHSKVLVHISDMSALCEVLQTIMKENKSD